MQEKIVLVGGPGSGKTSVINELEKRGFYCMPEISRSIIIEAQKKGIEQLFLTSPMLFSEKLLEGRCKQFEQAEQLSEKNIFFDRGIPEITAYLNYSKTTYPDYFKEKNKTYLYNKVFFFPPWKEIYIDDNERYETFEQAVEISKYIIDAYNELNYNIVTVPFSNIKNRCNFIENFINKN